MQPYAAVTIELNGTVLRQRVRRKAVSANLEPRILRSKPHSKPHVGHYGTMLLAFSSACPGRVPDGVFEVGYRQFFRLDTIRTRLAEASVADPLAAMQRWSSSRGLIAPPHTEGSPYMRFGGERGVWCHRLQTFKRLGDSEFELILQSSAQFRQHFTDARGISETFVASATV